MTILSVKAAGRKESIDLNRVVIRVAGADAGRVLLQNSRGHLQAMTDGQAAVVDKALPALRDVTALLKRKPVKAGKAPKPAKK